MDSLTARERTQAAGNSLCPPRIYNLFPRLFRDFAHMAEFLPHVASMRFDWVFLNPIHQAGFSGSLYSVKDHFALDAGLAGEATGDLETNLAAFCRRAEEAGLNVMLDLVINHVAIDSVLVSEHPEWLAREDNGELAHPSAIDPADANKRTVWGDLAALDYGRTEYHDAIVAYWTRLIGVLVDAGVRGFRCDAAYQVSGEIWRRVIDAARARKPGLLFAAETLGCRVDEVERLTPAGFDYLFNSSKWWDLRAPWAVTQYEAFRHIAPSIAFPESHDTPRLATEYSNLNDAELKRLYLMRYALAASFSTGVMMPVGYEFGFSRPLHVVETRHEHWEEKRFDLTRDIARINTVKAASPALAEEGPLRRIAIHPELVVLHRASNDGRHHALFVVNPNAAGSTIVDRDTLARAIDLPQDALIDRYGFEDSARITLSPYEWRLLTAERQDQETQAEIFVDPALPETWNEGARVAIEAVYPEIDAGRFPIKRIVGDIVTVWADLFRDGHDLIGGRILYRPADERTWQTAELRFYDNDRWSGSFSVDRVGRWLYTVEAWSDAFATWRRDVIKKRDAGQDLAIEMIEGVELIEEAAASASGIDRDILADLLRILPPRTDAQKTALLLSAELLAVMERWGPRRDLVRHGRILEAVVDRREARFAAWYEIMPRSQGRDPNRSATFADCIARVPDIAAMGFDVLYLLPIHPIGRVNRKGPNNTLTPGPDDPGSPYAIGSALGGHTAIEPGLGVIEDFRALVDACLRHGMEVALDFAVQCAPDHPWVNEHPDWFKWRPDGTIKYAENPPKKYQDIVNVEFYGPHRAELWRALADIVHYWAREGVRIFRVDNPHTKPLPFWEWLIRDVQSAYPDVVFLAEAFTKPKMMRRLAKAGFTMSYTYFTWRNTKVELTEYAAELATSESREYFRPNFFANTPDILPAILQSGNPAAFRIRVALATLLSGVYGIYSGFELCEGTAIPGTEDYLHSEKYQFKVWDWDRPGNIKAFIAALNRVRRENAALQDWTNVRFHEADSDRVLFFSKTAPDRSHTIFIVISLDIDVPVSANLSLPFASFGMDPGGAETENLLGGNKLWLGPGFRAELSPENPVLLMRYRQI